MTKPYMEITTNILSSMAGDRSSYCDKFYSQLCKKYKKLLHHFR